MPSYDLTPKADLQLSEIWVYTYDQWGMPQADKYLNDLHRDFQLLADGQLVGRSCKRLYPAASEQLQFYLSGKHYVIYRIIGQRLVVLAILHSSSYSLITDFLKTQ